MAHRKRFIAKQAVGGLLVSVSAVALLAILFTILPRGLWTLVGLVSTLAVGGAIALSVFRLTRSDDYQGR